MSSATSQIFNTATNTFLKVGSLNTARESAAAVPLPNHLTLIVGGENCRLASYNLAPSGAFLCQALQTAELYHEDTMSFSLAGSGSSNKMTIGRSGPTATLIEGSGTSLDGQVLIVGGSTGISFLGATTPQGAPAQTALNTAELYNPGTDAFTAVSNPIPGCPAGESPVSTPVCANALPSVCGLPTVETAITSTSESSSTVTVVTASNPPGLTMGSTVYVAGVATGTAPGTLANGYNGTWIVTGIADSQHFTYTAAASGLAAGTGGFAAAGNIVSASESGTTATITLTTPLSGLIVGDNVTVNAIEVGGSFAANGYDGQFVVTGPGTTGQAITGTTFTYTAPSSGLASGTGGTAVADTFECGMVDQGAALIPNDGGKVLLAGGDFITFLGESSPFSFIFDPTTQTFSKTTGNLTTARELDSLVAMDPAVVTGALSGDVVAFGGVQANSAVCPAGSGMIVVTTSNTAEVFNPGSGTWSPAANTMGAKKAVTSTLIEAGKDAGMVLLPGGVDVEAGTFPSTCSAVTNLTQAATGETDLYAPDTGTGGTFTATGTLNQPREGASQGVLGSGTDVTEFLIAGGACTQPTPTLESSPIGSSSQLSTCGTSGDYSELYNQAMGTWTVGPTFASGFAPSNAAATAVLP